MSKFNILTKAEEVVGYIFVITEQCPKKTRLDLVAAIRNKSLIMLENVITANFLPLNNNEATTETRERRYCLQKDCLIQIRVLESFLEICKQRSYISNAQMAYATKLTQELFDLIKNWHEKDKKR